VKQKVWAIDDPTWQDSSEQTRKEVPPQGRREADNPSSTVSSTKSPALSFSFSMVLWGSGQIFIGAYRPGVIFMAIMLLFYGTLSAVLFFGGFAGRFIAEIGIPMPVMVAGAVVYLFAGLACWLANAVDAYYRTTRIRIERFRGLDNELWPLFGSLLFPGWGQFLNGQPKKGLFFLSCGGLGIFSGIFLALTRYIWPVFGKGPVGHALELFLIVSAYDAFFSCKQLFLEKLRRNPSIDNSRKRVTVKGIMPRLSAILALLLAISVGNQLVPKGYYRHCLERIRSEAIKHEMDLIPALMGKAIEVLDTTA
jgi:TM2 domain-containing membrane protein YozV